MHVIIDIPDQLISDTIITALEHGCGYWASEGKLYNNNGEQVQGWCPDDPLENLSKIIIVEDDEEKTEHTLKIAKSGQPAIRDFCQIKEGLAKMAKQYPQHFANMVDRSGDAETADVFMQCCILGKIIYG